MVRVQPNFTRVSGVGLGHTVVDNCYAHGHGHEHDGGSEEVDHDGEW